MRRNIYDILQKANIDLNKEYSRIYDLFYNTYFYDVLDEVTLYDTANEYFFSFDKKLIKKMLNIG